MNDEKSIPEGNNVYGRLIISDGMKPALRSIQQLVGTDNAHVYVSGYDGASTLRFSTKTCDFESTQLDSDHQHLLNGAVAGSVQDVIRFVKQLSARLADADIKHSFEVYDDSENPVFMISW